MSGPAIIKKVGDKIFLGEDKLEDAYVKNLKAVEDALKDVEKEAQEAEIEAKKLEEELKEAEGKVKELEEHAKKVNAEVAAAESGSIFDPMAGEQVEAKAAAKDKLAKAEQQKAKVEKDLAIARETANGLGKKATEARTGATEKTGLKKEAETIVATAKAKKDNPAPKPEDKKEQGAGEDKKLEGYVKNILKKDKEFSKFLQKQKDDKKNTKVYAYKDDFAQNSPATKAMTSLEGELEEQLKNEDDKKKFDALRAHLKDMRKNALTSTFDWSIEKKKYDKLRDDVAGLDQKNKADITKKLDAALADEFKEFDRSYGSHVDLMSRVKYANEVTSMQLGFNPKLTQKELKELGFKSRFNLFHQDVFDLFHEVKRPYKDEEILEELEGLEGQKREQGHVVLRPDQTDALFTAKLRMLFEALGKKKVVRLESKSFPGVELVVSPDGAVTMMPSDSKNFAAAFDLLELQGAKSFTINHPEAKTLQYAGTVKHFREIMELAHARGRQIDISPEIEKRLHELLQEASSDEMVSEIKKLFALRDKIKLEAEAGDKIDKDITKASEEVKKIEEKVDKLGEATQTVAKEIDLKIKNLAPQVGEVGGLASGSLPAAIKDVLETGIDAKLKEITAELKTATEYKEKLDKQLAALQGLTKNRTFWEKFKDRLGIKRQGGEVDWQGKIGQLSGVYDQLSKQMDKLSKCADILLGAATGAIDVKEPDPEVEKKVKELTMVANDLKKSCKVEADSIRLQRAELHGLQSKFSETRDRVVYDALKGREASKGEEASKDEARPGPN